MAKQKIIIDKIPVRIDKDGYICLSDLAKQVSEDTSDVIKSYIKNRANLEFLELWETNNNEGFNHDGMKELKDKIWQNGYFIRVGKYIEETNAKGITAKVGRYGGTYAHQKIAIHFASWISPSFYYYMITEFERLKEEEQTSWLKAAKFYIDRAEQYNLEGYRFSQDAKKFFDDKLNNDK